MSRDSSVAASEAARNLLATLDEIDRPGSFCTGGSLPLVLPGLEINEVGPIGLPLSTAQAKALIKRCAQAPFGKGEETLVDTNVRRVWQLDPDEFTLANPDWQAFVDKITKDVQRDLGLENQNLKSQLYKLLVYEKGSFFVSHRDSEKMDRMVATLVIVLPTAHEGGQLIVRHDGGERVFEFGDGAAAYQVQYAAFYADCRHEVKPVRKGHRLCLVYNLALSGKQKAIAAPKTSGIVRRAADLLGGWEDQTKCKKLAVVLDHQYTKQGLTFDDLKGTDRVKAQVMLEAAREAGWKAHLASLTLWESGYPGYSGYSFDRYYMEEVFESALTAEHWTDAVGAVQPMGKIAFTEEEVVCDGELRDVDPEEDYQEYTGNEGATLEQWYRHAVIALWPNERHFNILCEAGHGHAVAMLERMAAALKGSRAKADRQLRDECVEFARQIIAAWPNAGEYGYFATRDASVCRQFTAVLKKLKDDDLIRALIRDVLPKDLEDVPGKDIATLCKKQWAKFQDDLMYLFSKTSGGTLQRNASLLEAICTAKDKQPAREALCQKLGRVMVETIHRWDPRRASDWRHRKVDRVALLDSLCKSLFVSGQYELLDQLVSHVQSRPKEYPRSEVQVAALRKAAPWLSKDKTHDRAAMQTWLDECIAELESAAANPPKPPTNWKQPARLSCSCADCKELAAFLKNPDEQVHRFSVRKDRRRHLHYIIDKHACDVTHVTDRRGSPQTLVCTKTQAAYDRQVKQHELDVKHLAELRKLRETM